MTKQFPDIDTQFEAEEQESGTPFFRSFYKGYALKEVTGSDGITRNEYIYTGTFYEFDGSSSRYLFVKIAHVLLLAFSVLCVALGDHVNSTFSLTKVYAACLFAIILMLVLWAFSLLLYCFAPARMKEWDYEHSVKYLTFYAKVITAASAVVMVGGAVFFLIHREFNRASWSSLFLYFLMLLSGLGAWILTKKTRFRVIDSEDISGDLSCDHLQNLL